MPKRKAAAALSSLAGSDDESIIQPGGDRREGARPAKKPRGRPRSKSTELRASPQMRRESTTQVATQEATEGPGKKSGRRGRPKGSRNSVQAAPSQDEPDHKDWSRATEAADEPEALAQPAEESTAVSNDELAEAQNPPPKPSKRGKLSKSAKTGSGAGGARSRGKTAEKQVVADGGFEYTPSSKRRQRSPRNESEAPPRKTRVKEKAGVKDTQDLSEVEDDVPEEAAEEVDETVLQDAPNEARSRSASPAKRRQSLRDARVSPSKPRTSDEPELRRKIGELTKKCDTLESRYRTLKEIGIVEANANMEKLRNQCESMTAVSDKMIAALKTELEAQKVLGQQSRKLQKQLQNRDEEVAQLKAQAEETESQLSSAQNEVKALQTKLSAARNTAASLESAAATMKVPGSAIKGGSNRATAAASAEAAQAAQYAQLKEDLYSDLTGLIIRDIKKRQSDILYDCIQTGSNGTLHFKLVVPHVSSTNYESAEFQYIPLLDDKRDRDLIDILPEYLTVDITFARQQASKFYTRVIDALTKRRSTAAS
ncbi:putative chromosome segregation protein (Pcs1) [Aspergillus saccharolyticus JOP 1030-1]|uniref:Monopolin complex subunit Csm1/Pcs1 C-terminal domain-containing protein n=1 Tax=Aspergillus saccharolyticus JOP 1030-1 TaxID=1450539 RepID=A0A318ZR44_9EURO|nr:hypothetical protein BP01DRAFT_337717 [Aspergillus saccharolyticus JOP 1030-1]PYH46420.1 hypothetical protein BP01DRAFT_337717 [Aspergillus saccharolyticus JOP 1030-1]